MYFPRATWPGSHPGDAADAAGEVPSYLELVNREGPAGSHDAAVRLAAGLALYHPCGDPLDHGRSGAFPAVRPAGISSAAPIAQRRLHDRHFAPTQSARRTAALVMACLAENETAVGAK